MKISTQVAKHKAFSLIEISLAILIIGILVAGISKGADLYEQSRLNVARQLTINSRVPRINGLLFWVETTLEKSLLATETAESSPISQWNDINPFAIEKLYLTRVANNFITYKKSSIGNLPSIYFNGNGGTLNLSTAPTPTQLTFFKTTNQVISVFMVIDGENSTSNKHRVLFTNGNTSTSGVSLFQSRDNRLMVLFGGVNLWSSTNQFDFSANAIICFTYGGVGTFFAQIYRNGSFVNLPSINRNPNNAFGSFAIAGNNTNDNEAWKGNISELIVYDRVITPAERIEIQDYLSKKYAIKIIS